MRVLTVGNLYPPHHFGGYEQVWQSAVAHLRRTGADVRVLATSFRHPAVDDGDETGVHRSLRWYWRDHEFAPVPLAERVRMERHNHAVLARHLVEQQPHVVAFWSMGGMSHSLIEAVRLRRLPIVVFAHDAWVDYGRFTDQWLRLFSAPSRRLPARVLHRLTGLPTSVDYGGAGRWVFVSEHLRRHATAVRPDLVDTAIAHSGISEVFLGPAPERPWRWRLAHVGRLHPDKGIHDAVRALLDLPPEATLTFAGTWDRREEDRLHALVAELALGDRVTFLGHVPHAELPAVYHAHDAVLFPVVWEEPWGLVPLEAMASGCAVVATGRGGSREYLRDGENCVLVPAEDPPALARAVRRLADDPDLRARLRAGGRATAELHTAEGFDKAVARHLREVARMPASGDRVHA